MQELIGQTIDRYKISDFLAEDQLGSIYRAYDPKFDRTVTLYYVNTQVAKQHGLDEYILQAARTILSWRHAGLARIYDFGKREDGIYVVQEFIPGPDLRQIIKDLRAADAWIELGEAVALVRELCLAIEFAHQRGLIHGEINPSNVFIKPEPVDNLPFQPVLTRTGFVKPNAPNLNSASPQYIAPEVFQGKHLEKYADIYSLGALLYRLTTGQAPAPQTMAAPTSAQVLAPRLLHPDMPEVVEKVIQRALALNPDDRFNDANSFAATLASIQNAANKVHTPPAGIKTTGKLLDYYQLDLTETKPSTPNAPAPVAQSVPTPLPFDFSQDQIHVLAPDKTLHSYSMQPEGLNIGRGKDNQIQLDFAGISRQHARIEFDGENYLIHDLNSLNGTFVEEKRVPGDSPQVWLPGENVRIGEAWLRLERAGQARTTQAMVAGAVTTHALPTQPGKSLPDTDEVFLRPDGTRIDPNQVLRSANLGWLGAYTDIMNPSVTPGGSLELPIQLFNRGPASDTYLLSIQGMPSEWLVSPPQPVRVPSNNQSLARMVIRPPRSPLVRAGRYGLTIRIVSQASPDQAVELRPVLTVTAFSLFTSELSPQVIRPDDPGQVAVHNRGNLPEGFSVLWEDNSHSLIFDPPEVKFNLEAGKSAVVEFTPKLRNPQWFGAEQTHQFTAHVSTKAGHMQSHPGSYISHSLVPSWAPFLIGLLSLVLACVLCLFLNQITSPVRQADRTAQAGRTSIALATQTVLLARTQTATTLVGANLSTLQAATATSAWLALDSDNDGLINSQELLAATDPNKPDTDGDGLLDGIEINTWHTDPLKTDTDGDGLSDSQEIDLGTNPLDRDSDGDGIPDGSDPDPLHAPTSTFEPFPTFTRRPQATNTPWWNITPIWWRTPVPPTHTNTPKPLSSDLGISISNGSTQAIPGTTTIYTILVTNKGTTSLTNLRISDTFPSTLSNITWLCMATPGSLCQTGNGSGNINALANLAVGGAATLTVNASILPNASGLLANTARVDPPSGIVDGNPADNQATDTDTLTPKVALSLTKTDNHDSVNPGQATSYTIIVFNNGPSAVSGVTIVDPFSDKLSGITWSCNATAGSSCALSGVQSGNINTSASLNPGGTVTITANATVKPSASGLLSNIVNITSPIDPGVNNKSATDTTNITAQANLGVVASAPVTATISTDITYSVAITNTGPNIATGVVLTGTLGPGGVFVSSNPGGPTCTQSAGVVICNLGNLGINATTTVTVVVTVPGVAGPYDSIFVAKSAEGDPLPSNNSSVVSVSVN